MKNKGLPLVKKTSKEGRREDNWDFYNFSEDDIIGLVVAATTALGIGIHKHYEMINKRK